MVYVVFCASGDEHVIAGIFDNKPAAKACAESFTDRFAYAQEWPINTPLRSFVSLSAPR
jgi:hypothetical protein